MRPLAVIILLGLCTLAGEGHAQGLQTSIDAANRRWTEYQEALESSDPVARSEALRAALADENVGIRNNALWLALRNRSGLAASLVVQLGTRVDPGEVPDVAVAGLRWDSQQRTFGGAARSHRAQSRVDGELTEGKLRIRYHGLQMPAHFGLSGDSPPSRRPFVRRTCTVVLTVNPADRALTGPLQCEGLAQTFAVRMPLS